MKPRIAIPSPTSIDLDYNRRCLPLYMHAIEEAGGIAVELPLTASPTKLQTMAATCTGILLPGSLADVDPGRFGQAKDAATAPADLARETADTLLLDHAAAHHLPVLGICYGLQSINVWRGGTLLQDLMIMPVNHPAGPSIAIAHTAAVAPQSLLGTLLTSDEAPLIDTFARLPVNSSHHQAIGILGQNLRVTARCPQDGVIEGIEAEVWSGVPMLLAVQWHPERSYAISAASRALFARLIAEAGKERPSRASQPASV